MNISFIIVLIALAANLVIAPFNPEIGNIAYLGVSVVALLLCFIRAREHISRPIIWMPLLAFLLIGISYFIGHGGTDGLMGLLYVAPVLTILPLTVAAEKAPRRNWHAVTIPAFATLGITAAMTIAVRDYLTTGTSRAGESAANPIHFADVALLVGFIPAIGLLLLTDKRRWLFLLAPIFACVAVFLSGSRGALITIPVMLGVGYLALGLFRVLPRRVVLFSAFGVTIVGVVLVAVAGTQISAINRVLVDIGQMLENGVTRDSTNYERVQMIIGGWGAFLEAPIFGHGPLAFQGVAERYGDFPNAPVPHLHNDIVDFLASGGIVGFLAYALMMLAPLAEAWRVRKSRQGSALLSYALMLVSGFFFMGLTNAMFGILTLTNYYAVICVITAIFAGAIAREVSPARKQ